MPVGSCLDFVKWCGKTLPTVGGCCHSLGLGPKLYNSSESELSTKHTFISPCTWRRIWFDQLSDVPATLTSVWWWTVTRTPGSSDDLCTCWNYIACMCTRMCVPLLVLLCPLLHANIVWTFNMNFSTIYHVNKLSHYCGMFKLFQLLLWGLGSPFNWLGSFVGTNHSGYCWQLVDLAYMSSFITNPGTHQRTVEVPWQGDRE